VKSLLHMTWLSSYPGLTVIPFQQRRMLIVHEGLVCRAGLTLLLCLLFNEKSRYTTSNAQHPVSFSSGLWPDARITFLASFAQFFLALACGHLVGCIISGRLWYRASKNHRRYHRGPKFVDSIQRNLSQNLRSDLQKQKGFMKDAQPCITTKTIHRMHRFQFGMSLKTLHQPMWRGVKITTDMLHIKCQSTTPLRPFD
jgi:hypothetical protein